MSKRQTRSWTIDNYDGEESFREMVVEPVPRQDAVKDMPPEKFQAMRRQLHGVEMELDKLMNEDEVGEDPRERQWKHWSKIVMDVCEEFGDGEDEESGEDDVENCPPLGISQTGESGLQTTWRHGQQSYHVS